MPDGLNNNEQHETAAALVARARACFFSGLTLSMEQRRRMLRALEHSITEQRESLAEALWADLRKPPLEAMATEIAFVTADIRHALRNLKRWTAPRRCKTPLATKPGRGWVQAEPYGVALIMGPWNYPLQLLFSPMVAAIAAGNTVVLKPSEQAPRTADAIACLTAKLFPEDWIICVRGDAAVAECLLRQKFDRIFFTGNAVIGRKIMAAASRTLTPVTLELGGKSPCLVCADARVDVAARRIVWGKFLNAGQTCVAPDYVMAHRDIYAQLLKAMCAAIRLFYGADPRQSRDYGRIVNRRHFDRLAALLGDGRPVCGGQTDRNDLYIAPTILEDVSEEAPIMEKEIFGPLLPVLPFDELDHVLARLRGMPSPLALYLFTENRSVEKHVLQRTVSGGVCINDTISHILSRRMPFGGVGESGMGAYHGKTGFDEFTHYRSVLRRGTRRDPRFRYPPSRLSPDGLRRLYPLLFRD